MLLSPNTTIADLSIIHSWLYEWYPFTKYDNSWLYEWYPFTKYDNYWSKHNLFTIIWV